MYKGYYIRDTDLNAIRPMNAPSIFKQASICEEITPSEDYAKKIISFLNDNRRLLRECSNSFSKSASDSARKTLLDNFPLLKLQVFLSHSHGDEGLAKRYAGWLKSNFDISCFIDSQFWSHINKLTLSGFDQKELERTLKESLHRMIDKTECFMFINTENSLSKYNGATFTLSKWILEELEISRKIIKKTPEHVRQNPPLRKTALLTKIAALLLEDKYPIDIEHLKQLSENDLRAWKNNFSSTVDSEYALRYLYDNLPMQ